MNEALKEALEAIGAVLDIAGFIKDELLKRNFSEDEAYTIAHDYIICQLSGGKKKGDD
jgi:hypothetical protein